MKKLVKPFCCIILCIFAMNLLGCESKPKDIGFKWSDITTAKYRYDDNVNYILAVKYVGASDAKIFLYEKDKNNKNAWTEVLNCDGIVGKNGIGKTKEGDNMAPKGDFPILMSFGIKNNPGTRLPYLDINDNIYACEDENNYNKIIDINVYPHECNGEHMIDYSPEYNYGFKIGYNIENTMGKGSSIFFHCKGAKSYTGGCIAVDEVNVKKILQIIDNTTRVVIDVSD